MSKLPADHDVREQALDPTQSFIVQAPAGSGKTELLTRRVLKLLCQVNEPEEILAITFTRKAASEMRQRVVKALQHAATNPSTHDAHEQEGIALAQAVLQRDAQFDWQLVRNPQRLNLRTIDSLATQLAHRLPITSTLGAPTGLEENAYSLYQEAAARFIEAHLDSLDRVLLHLGNKLNKAQDLLAGLLAKRDQWKRHVYNAPEDHDELRRLLEGMLAELVESRLQNLCELLPEGLEQVLMPTLAKAYEFALMNVDGDKSELAWEIQCYSDMNGLPGADVAELNLWGSIAFALLTSDNKLRKTVRKTEGFPAKTDAKKLGVSSADLVSHKEAMTELLSRLGHQEDFLAALVEVRKLPYPAYQDEQWALLSQLLTVLPMLLVELQLVFAEHALIDFNEISARAALSLGTDDAPTDLALAMDLSLQHLLVDEFQDTSQTQFRLFEQLVAPWEPGDGRTFFAVGDPMQSIYRFREGDVSLFTRVQQRGIASTLVRPLTLSVNFRAAPVVTQWVNDTFSKIFPLRAESDTGAIPYSPSEAFRDYAGQVQMHPLIDQDKSAEARRVAQICTRVIADDPEHSVAILVRSRTQSIDIFTALRAAGLAFESIDMDRVGVRPVVRDLMAVTLALRYPHDRLNWLAMLRSPFVGLTLHDLHALLDGAGRQAAVIECLQNEQFVQTLSDDGQLRIARLLNVVEPAIKRSLRDRLMPWVEAVWLQLGGPVVCDSDVDRDAAQRALERLYELETRGELWQPSVISDAMEKLYAAPATTEGCQIQVMTLHKSKGLEFDTVILPALDRQPRRDGTQLLNWFESTLHGESQLLLAPFEQTGIAVYQRDKINKLVQRARERCDAQEKLRLLYVACTRARRQLHLLGRVATDVEGELRNPITSSLLAALWPAVQMQFTQPAKAYDFAQEHEDRAEIVMPDTSLSVPQFRRLPVTSSMPEFNVFNSAPHFPSEPDNDSDENVSDENDRPEYQWAGRSARDIGTVIHDQLQLLSDRSADQSEPKQIQSAVIRRQLRNLGMNESLLEAATTKVISALRNTLSCKRGQWILKPWEEARSEWALTIPTPGPGIASVQRFVIDRTFVDEQGVRWIVDYKTGDHEGANVEGFLDKEQERYAEQLNRYAWIVKRLDARPVRVGLYFPMLKGWREWDPAIKV